MNKIIPCVLMRAGTSRGPFFLREWLPESDAARDEALIGAIGASDPLQLDGVGGGSTLNSKVAIVSRSTQPDCDLDYLFAQVGVGHRSVDTRPNCGNMLSGVAPFGIEQGLVQAQEGITRVRVFNVNTRSRIDVTVRTPNRRVTYEGEARIDGVAGTAAPILLDFLDAWGAVTGHVFPTGRRIDHIDGTAVTCIDAAMPLMIIRAADLGVTGREKPVALDANTELLERIETLRLQAGRMMGLGDVSNSVIPKPVLVSEGDTPNSITSRYFTPRRCHASHAVTGAIGVASAFALPGTVASGIARAPGGHQLVVLHPAGQIDVEVELEGQGQEAQVKRAALVRTARKIMQGEMHLPDYVFSRPAETATTATAATPVRKPITIIVPTSAGGGNDTMARIVASKMGPLLGQEVLVDNRAGANGAIASEYVAHAEPDGHTLMFGYVGTHAMNPALQKLGYDPVADFAPIGLVGSSPTLMVAHPGVAAATMAGLVAQLRAEPGRITYASAGDGTPPHFAAALFQLGTDTVMTGVKHEGAAPAIADTASGRTQLMFPSLFTALPFIRSGQLRALAVAGPVPLPSLPGVRTLAEAGVAGVEVTQWYGLFAPAHTPADVLEKLNRALNQVLADPAVIAHFESNGASVEPGSADALATRVQADLARWRAVVAQGGLAAPEPRMVAVLD
ncbi:methylitaconate delta2-delta3-isomerase [Rhodoferax koreense]|uniref:Methylitaconate delta2-delta3-isomerase n=1 Tax=Rhodoferax koreensis TaxID=1842727 RepID=A0A1P8K1B5_9BURK|nr:4-oxalomesaconate tautomerase [Rhodoferax koreense]APW39803.1 methylitaconate delta2-delta3-isomerase [Rhodoferax koreense]